MRVQADFLFATELLFPKSTKSGELKSETGTKGFKLFLHLGVKMLPPKKWPSDPCVGEPFPAGMSKPSCGIEAG